mmetsp:Transcript_16376/g.42209  ORF Transcript_16376/g.42209 Transcript_16376/m.42209 type:complete len:276 (-) Transcript_16376:688-1515(-)
MGTQQPFRSCRRIGISRDFASHRAPTGFSKLLLEIETRPKLKRLQKSAIKVSLPLILDEPLNGALRGATHTRRDVERREAHEMQVPLRNAPRPNLLHHFEHQLRVRRRHRQHRPRQPPEPHNVLQERLQHRQPHLLHRREIRRQHAIDHVRVPHPLLHPDRHRALEEPGHAEGRLVRDHCGEAGAVEEVAGEGLVEARVEAGEVPEHGAEAAEGERGLEAGGVAELENAVEAGLEGAVFVGGEEAEERAGAFDGVQRDALVAGQDIKVVVEDCGQ